MRLRVTPYNNPLIVVRAMLVIIMVRGMVWCVVRGVVRGVVIRVW